MVTDGSSYLFRKQGLDYYSKIDGKVVILVDDGAATGATIIAAEDKHMLATNYNDYPYHERENKGYALLHIELRFLLSFFYR
jgi:hypoxanthine phosphoribosyltransferase